MCAGEGGRSAFFGRANDGPLDRARPRPCSHATTPSPTSEFAIAMASGSSEPEEAARSSLESPMKDADDDARLSVFCDAYDGGATRDAGGARRTGMSDVADGFVRFSYVL